MHTNNGLTFLPNPPESIELDLESLHATDGEPGDDESFEYGGYDEMQARAELNMVREGMQRKTQRIRHQQGW